MTRRDVSGGEMPRLPFPHRPGRPDPAQLDALLRPGSSGLVGTEWQAVSEVLQAAAAPAAPSELAGEAAMLAAFRRAQLGTDGAPARRRLLERPRMLTTMLTGKLAAALAAAA